MVRGERGSRAALAGFVFSILFAIGWLLLQRSPPVGAADKEILDYFTSVGGRRNSRLAGLYVIPFAGIAFIWFMAALRDRIVRAGGREHAVLSTVQLISGTVFVAALFAVGAAELSTVWVAESAGGPTLDIDAARGIIALGAATAQIVAIRASAVFIAVSTTRAMRAGLFPRWFCYTGFAMALALLVVATTWRPVVLVIPAWVLAASFVVIAQRLNRSEPIEA